MTEPGEPGKGATSYALSPKAIKQSDGKSKVKPAPLDLSQVVDVGNDKGKEQEKEQDESVSVKKKETKIGHRRINEDGQITYKKQPSSALVSAIQLGIAYSVGRLSSKVERDVLMNDFYEIESVFFPSEGGQETPAHHYSDFRFKAYGPVAFRYFRELFHIAPDDFLMSLCHEPLRELSNPGASGSLFYCSMDDQFIIKTVQHKEAEFLQKLLPGYYLNLNQNKRTLLPKFFGLYCYQDIIRMDIERMKNIAAWVLFRLKYEKKTLAAICKEMCGGKNIRLVLMNNLLPSGYKIHLKYDLKGSTYKRKASKAERAKSSPTLKDLDYMNDHPEGISLDSETYSALIKTIQRDCRVLESFKIMDYSLLLAIHNVDEAAREKREARGEASSTGGTRTTGATSTNNEDRKASEKSTDEQAKGVGSAGVARNPSARNRDDFAAYWEAIPQHRDDTPYGAIRARNAKGDRLLLFIGVIDILQSYRLKKRLEHGLKSVVQDGDAISVHRPSFYARRFQDFMAEKVFRKLPGTKAQIARSPSKKRASFNTGRGKERVRTSSDTDKHVNRVTDTSKSLANKVTLSPSLDAGLANAVPGDVSFMGRETKSLDLMAQKPLLANNVEPASSHDASTDTQEDSTITFASSTMTHEGSTAAAITHEGSTLNGQSSPFEHSVTSQELSNVDIQQSEGAENVSESTPKQTSSARNDNVYIVSRQVVFAVRDDDTDGPHPKSSADKPSISEVAPNDSDDITGTSGVIPNTSENVVSISEDVTTTSTNEVPSISDSVPSTSGDVVEHSMTTIAHSSDTTVDSGESGNAANNVEELCTPVNNEVVEDKTSDDYKRRQSSTDSEPSVSDSIL